jgi:hypothetical protein
MHLQSSVAGEVHNKADKILPRGDEIGRFQTLRYTIYVLVGVERNDDKLGS